jgi:hypothetical protein
MHHAMQFVHQNLDIKSNTYNFVLLYSIRACRHIASKEKSHRILFPKKSYPGDLPMERVISCFSEETDTKRRVANQSLAPDSFLSRTTQTEVQQEDVERRNLPKEKKVWTNLLCICPKVAIAGTRTRANCNRCFHPAEFIECRANRMKIGMFTCLNNVVCYFGGRSQTAGSLHPTSRRCLCHAYFCLM